MKRIIKHTVHVSKKHPYHVSFFVLLTLFCAVVFSILSRTTSSFAAGNPPENLFAPSLQGTAAVGEIMTVNEGGWAGSPTFTYQWRSCDTGGNNCVDINSATNNTYTIAQSDAGNTLRAIVIGTNADGSTPATSNASPVVQAQLGDINNDGVINIFDLGILLGHWGCGTGCELEDLNSDGIVDATDVSRLLQDYAP